MQALDFPSSAEAMWPFSAKAHKQIPGRPEHRWEHATLTVGEVFLIVRSGKGGLIRPPAERLHPAGDSGPEAADLKVQLRLNDGWKQEAKKKEARELTQPWCKSSAGVMGALVGWSETPPWPVVSAATAKFKRRDFWLNLAGTGSKRLFIVQQRQVGGQCSQAAHIDKQPKQDQRGRNQKVDVERSHHQFQRSSRQNV